MAQDFPRNLFLVGPMGVGKTTIGRSLADRLQLTFYDADHEIERRAGADIPWIFDVEGEQGFRNREVAVTDDLTSRKKVLVATGGGAVLREENRRCLVSRGTVVYLATTVEIQIKRTERDRKRPLLATEDPAAVLRALKKQRDPIYEEVADVTYHVGEESSRRVVNGILRALKALEF